MANFASRLQEAQNTAANTRAANIAEAHAMVETVAEILVSQIEALAANGLIHLSACCEVSEQQICCYTKLLDLSKVEDGVKSFKEALRDLTENTGELQIATTVLNGMHIILTV